MTDEPKKLPTTYTGHLTPDLYRLVQEQREVMKLMIKALRGHERADVAIAAAAPYIQD